MKKGMKIILVLFAVLFAVMLAGCVALHMYDVAKKQYVTDPIIAHIPLRADLDFYFPDPDDKTLMNIRYTLKPSVDVKINVSEGLILPEEIVFVENNFPTNPITVSKGRTYKYSGTIKVVKSGSWIIYVSPGVYANVTVLNGRRWISIQKVRKATVPLTRFRLRENISEEQEDVLMDVTKNWLLGYSAREYEREEFNCTVISADPDIRCYGCELMGYSSSRLHDKYYFVIDEDRHIKEIKIRNVYRWAYQTPAGYQRKPVCEEITKTKNI